MGIYFNNWVYQGRLLRKETYEKIKNDSRFKKFLTCLSSDIYILHIPNRCVKIGWLDPVIEGHELQQGFVSLTEVTQKLSEDLPDKWEAWQSVEDKDIDELKYLIKLIDEKQGFGIYILEFSFSSYGKVLGDDVHLTKNLRCI